MATVKPSFDSAIALWRELSLVEQLVLVSSDNRPALKQFLRDHQKSAAVSQWVVEIDENTGGYTIVNPGPNGERQYYMVSPGKFGEPIITPEPDLAFEVPANLTCHNKKGEVVVPGEKISGIVCKDGPRFSLTNAKKMGVVVQPNPDGSIQVGEDQWWIATLFIKDGKRFRNYDAYLVRDEPPFVRVLELGDLDLFF